MEYEGGRRRWNRKEGDEGGIGRRGKKVEYEGGRRRWNTKEGGECRIGRREKKVEYEGRRKVGSRTKRVGEGKRE